MDNRFADLPFSQASENNKLPILTVLRRHLSAGSRVLEVGSGTGQHVVFFAEELPETSWQPSDHPDGVAVVAERVARAGLGNVAAPLALDVDVAGAWPRGPFDAVFSANTAHIMAWPSVQRMVAGAAAVLAPGGRLLLYGPFNEGGAFTSPSNEAFDAMLRGRDPASGLRDLEQVDAVARGVGLEMVERTVMPANNRLVLWRRTSGG
jgi:cyclopropane fatty-acyl-phospholipid synthase-like methyltransferase